MSARANRLTSADEFRLTIRRGRKRSTVSSLISLQPTAQELPVRFGFVVGKSVGNAVVRNRVRRRMKAAAFELVREGISGLDVVVRGRPTAIEMSVQQFRAEFHDAIVSV